MGKPTGFMEYDRCEAASVEPKERIKNFNEFHVFLSKENQQKQAARCMDCGVPFCQSGMTIAGMTSGCPLHNLVPEWNDLVYTGNWEQAYNRLHKTNNFPEFTSRVCPALCEKACTCGHWGSPVSVRDNEHGVIETAYANGYAAPKPPKVRTGKKVAIIGSGPSGLAAADQLNQRGHEVTVYEREDRVGGLLMYGIPNMKLDKSIVDRKVNIMKEEGIHFVTGCDVGKDIKPAELYKKYDRVILCCGAKNPRDIKADGRDAKGIYFAVDYLTQNTKSLLNSNLTDGKFVSAKGKNVVIIGGGDTGNDCVGTAIRQGAKSVTQLEMMPCPPTERAANNPWPEWPKVLKTDYGQEEAKVIENTVGNIFAGQVLGDTAKTLSERFGRIVQLRTSNSLSNDNLTTSTNTQLDSLIPASKISNLSQGMFVGAVADNFDERIEQKIFHAEIVIDREKLAGETASYVPIPEISSFRDADGVDRMEEIIRRNYTQIKEDVTQIIKRELRRIAEDPALRHLLAKK